MIVDFKWTWVGILIAWAVALFVFKQLGPAIAGLSASVPVFFTILYEAKKK